VQVAIEHLNGLVDSLAQHAPDKPGSGIMDAKVPHFFQPGRQTAPITATSADTLYFELRLSRPTQLSHASCLHVFRAP
jgi:hypothetical protein